MINWESSSVNWNKRCFQFSESLLYIFKDFTIPYIVQKWQDHILEFPERVFFRNNAAQDKDDK